MLDKIAEFILNTVFKYVVLGMGVLLQHAAAYHYTKLESIPGGILLSLVGIGLLYLGSTWNEL